MARLSSIQQEPWRLEFLHFYFTDQDLHRCVESTWDREPAALQLGERYQIEDDVIAQTGRLLELSEWESASQSLAMDHLAHWLIVQIAGRYGARDIPEPAVSGRFSRSQQRRLASRIDDTLAFPLDLATMAGWLNLSPYHFARLFRASFGIAPYQYVQEQRLLRAKRLLQHRSAKVTAVALECGFGDSSQFSRSFRRRFGQSPSEYRSGQT